MTHLTKARLFALSALFTALPALADTVVVSNLPYNDVTVTGIEGESILFTLRGNALRRPIGSVNRITVDNEPAFNAAETAYSDSDWDKATENYEKALRATQKPWLKEWISLRLLDSANKGGRFDAAIKGLIALAEKSPQTAAGIKLNMPQANSAYLTDAVTQLNAAITKAQRDKKDPVQDVLLAHLIEVHNARGDAKGAGEALERRMRLNPPDPNSPEGQRMAAMLRMQTIRVALGNKEYDKVMQLVQAEAENIIEPQQQAEALFALAEAKAGKAAGQISADWKEVALSYMRVVAAAPANAPQVPEALLKTAAIHEKQLKEPKTALRLYQQVAADFKGQPAAQSAEKEIARLK